MVREAVIVVEGAGARPLLATLVREAVRFMGTALVARLDTPHGGAEMTGPLAPRGPPDTGPPLPRPPPQRARPALAEFIAVSPVPETLGEALHRG